MVWDITKDSDWVGRPYYMKEEKDRLQMDFNYFYGKHNYNPTQPYENNSYVNWKIPYSDNL